MLHTIQVEQLPYPLISVTSAVKLKATQRSKDTRFPNALQENVTTQTEEE